MLKKLLASLLSVLCLFSIVGVNVSAAKSPMIMGQISYLEVFAGKTPSVKTLRPSKEGTGTEERELNYGDLFNDDVMANYCYAEVNSETSTYTLLNPGDTLVYGKEYAVIFATDSMPDFIDNDYYCHLFSVCWCQHYEKIVGEGGEIVYELHDSEVDGSQYLATYCFYATKLANEINFTGLNTGAGETITSQIKCFIDGEEVALGRKRAYSYFLADEFDKVTTEQDVMDSEIMDPSYIFEKGTRYYLSVCANEIFYGEGNKYEYYPSSDLLVKINGQKANDMNSIWPDTELESIKNGVDNARYYIEFVANEKTKQTDLIYTIPESYEWTITATVADSVDGNTEIDIVNKLLNVGNQKNSDGKVQINVEVNNWTLDLLHKLDVSVESTNDWNMCDQAIEKFEDAKAANRCASYKIVSELDDTKTWEANPNLITVMGKDDGTGAKSTGFFEWGDDGIPGLAGTYKDTLTFTAEINELSRIGGGIIVGVNFYDTYEEVEIDDHYIYVGNTIYHFYNAKGEEKITVTKDNFRSCKVQTLIDNEIEYYYIEGDNPSGNSVRIIATEDGTPTGNICFVNNVEWGANGKLLNPNSYNDYPQNNGKEATRIVTVDNNDKDIYIDSKGGNNTIWTVLKNANDNKKNGYDDWYIPGTEEMININSLLKNLPYEYDFIYSSNYTQGTSSAYMKGSTTGRGGKDRASQYGVVLFRSF
ncbi:MAG: hypothetical protein KBT35_08425 [Firmicutes bacterium]|nr:hypothetical protein [Candidatus Colivicinus equi]